VDRADVVEKDQRSKPKIGNRSKILSLRSMIFNRFSGAKETLCGTPPTVVKHQGVKQVISGKYPTHKSQIVIIFKVKIHMCLTFKWNHVYLFVLKLQASNDVLQLIA